MTPKQLAVKKADIAARQALSKLKNVQALQKSGMDKARIERQEKHAQANAMIGKAAADFLETEAKLSRDVDREKMNLEEAEAELDATTAAAENFYDVDK